MELLTKQWRHWQQRREVCYFNQSPVYETLCLNPFDMIVRVISSFDRYSVALKSLSLSLSIIDVFYHFKINKAVWSDFISNSMYDCQMFSI